MQYKMIMKLIVHSIIRNSEVNGPGSRYVLWMQGCSKRCPNCYNKHIQTESGGYPLSVRAITNDILKSNVEGITISGGEPFDQPAALFELLTSINGHIDQFPKGIICFTGYLYEELKSDTEKNKCLDLIDLIVDGPYIDKLQSMNCLAGSTNQRFIYLKKECRGYDLIGDAIFDQNVELHETEDVDEYLITGFPALDGDFLSDLGVEIIE